MISGQDWADSQKAKHCECDEITQLSKHQINEFESFFFSVLTFITAGTVTELKQIIGQVLNREKYYYLL